MNAKPTNNSRRRPVPDLERLGESIAAARDEMAALHRNIEAGRAELDAALIDGTDTGAKRAALRALTNQARAVDAKISELELQVAAFSATRLDQVVAAIANAAVASTQRMIEAHSRPINLEQFQSLGKQK